MTQKYIEDDLVRIKTEPNNLTPNKVVYKFVDYVAIDKVLIRTINGIDRLVEKDLIVPIPLTPKILSTNMFKIVRQDESGALYFKDGLGIDIVASYVRNCYDIYISGNKMLKDIKYLHQLQHLLFGLGLNSEMEVYVWK